MMTDGELDAERQRTAMWIKTSEGWMTRAAKAESALAGERLRSAQLTEALRGVLDIEDKSHRHHRHGDYCICGRAFPCAIVVARDVLAAGVSPQEARND